jgi:hypothetical protein
MQFEEAEMSHVSQVDLTPDSADGYAGVTF